MKLYDLIRICTFPFFPSNFVLWFYECFGSHHWWHQFFFLHLERTCSSIFLLENQVMIYQNLSNHKSKSKTWYSSRFDIYFGPKRSLTFNQFFLLQRCFRLALLIFAVNHALYVTRCFHFLYIWSGQIFFCIDLIFHGLIDKSSISLLPFQSHPKTKIQKSFSSSK